MVQLLINPNDKRFIFLSAETQDDQAQLVKLEKYMNKIPQYMLLPTYRGIPEAEVFLDKFKGKSGWVYFCAAGLWKTVVDFFTKQGWSLKNTIDSNFKYTPFSMTKAEFAEYVAGWNLNITPYDYQIESAWLILKYNLSLSELATRAGKTLIFYIVSRSAKELMGVKNILMIVPSIHLVKQGVKDLQEYAEYFNTEQIWSNGEEVEMADLTIGTFQSLVRRADPRYKTYNPGYFDKFDMVCVDEAHKAPCKSIKTILNLEAFKHLKLRFGFTGTLPKEGSIEGFACRAILGPKIQVIKARELIDNGFLADPIIKQFRIKYSPKSIEDITIKCAEYLLSSYVTENGSKKTLPKADQVFTMIHEKKLPVAIKESKKLLEKDEYIMYINEMCALSSKTLNLEQMMTMFSKPRLDLMDKIVRNLKKNVIIFAHNVEYIKFLEQHFKKLFPNRHVYKITGATSLKKRQQTLDKMLESDDCILIGGYGVVGTGLTIRRVDYGIFAQSFKSDVITRQSLGRLMLRTSVKSEFYLYDIIDEYPTKKLHKQALEKVKIYKSEGHQFSIEEIECDFTEVDPRTI